MVSAQVTDRVHREGHDPGAAVGDQLGKLATHVAQAVLEQLLHETVLALHQEVAAQAHAQRILEKGLALGLQHPHLIEVAQKHKTRRGAGGMKNILSLSLSLSFL